MDSAFDLMFEKGRTRRRWQERPVPEDLLRRLWDLTALPPTSANCQPARILFVVSADAKARLLPCLSPANRAQTAAAPVTAIIAEDLSFHHLLPRLYPAEDARAWFEGQPEKIRQTAHLNATLQGGYFILAARALGLDCGPMSGFRAAMVDAAFLAGTGWTTNLLCNLGYGLAEEDLPPRDPRLSFADACRIL